MQRIRRWQLKINEIYEKNNYYLNDEEVDYYFKLSLDAMLGFLIDSKHSKYLQFDPTGRENLGKAVIIMKDLKRQERDGIIIGVESGEVRHKIEYFRNRLLN